MRPTRFETFMHGLVEAAADPQVKGIRQVADCGYDAGHPFGHVVAFAGGGAVQLQYTAQQAPGDSYDGAEQYVEADAPMPSVPAVALPPGRIPTETVEAWLAALIVNSGSREVTSVERYSPNGAGQANPYGMTVGFKSGAKVYLSIVRAGVLDRLDRQTRFKPDKVA